MKLFDAISIKRPHVEKLGQTSWPELYTQSTKHDRERRKAALRAQQHIEYFSWVTTQPKAAKRQSQSSAKPPFRLRRTPTSKPKNLVEVSGSFHAFLWVVSPFRAALRSPFSVLSSFAESQNVHLSGRHQTVLSFGLTRCLAAGASWPISSFRVWFVRWLP